MTKRKLALLSGAAAVSLGMAGPALAFDRVDWSWDKEVVEYISKLVTIDVTFEPTGMTEVELSQIHIGDSIADATMHGVHNIPEPERELREFDFTATGSTSGSLDVDGTAEGFVDIDFGHWEDNCGVDGDSVCQGPGNEDDRVGLIGIAGNPAGESLTEGGADGIGVSGEFGSEDPLDVTGSTSGSLDVTVAGTVTVPVVVPWDAVAELPEMENLATALGNNTSINSNRMVEMHAGQFTFGDGDIDSEEEVLAAAATALLYGHLEHAGINTNQSAATALTAAAMTDIIDPSVIQANAEMYDVTQGQMTNAATALANNLSVDLDAATDGDAVLIGDVTQFAYADVGATAYMHDVSVQNYNNLGALDGALFSNVATSIGNNLSISVSGPEVSIPGNGNGNGNGNE